VEQFVAPTDRGRFPIVNRNGNLKAGGFFGQSSNEGIRARWTPAFFGRMFCSAALKRSEFSSAVVVLAIYPRLAHQEFWGCEENPAASPMKRFFEAGICDPPRPRPMCSCQTYPAPDCWRKRRLRIFGGCGHLPPYRNGASVPLGFQDHLLRRSPRTQRAAVDNCL